MIIENRLLRAAAHFANPDDLEQRPLCKAVWIEQKDGEIHISSTDGFMAAHFRLPTDDSSQVEKIGIASSILLDRRFRRRQDVKISSDGERVSMITPGGIPYKHREKIRSTGETIEYLPPDMHDPAVTKTDIPEFVQERITETKDNALSIALDDEKPRIQLSQQNIQKIGAALEEIHGRNDKGESYTITTTAADRPALIQINDHDDHFGNWEGLTAEFLVMPMHAPRDEKQKKPTVGLERIAGDWAVTLTGKHRTRTYSTHEERDDAIAAIRELLDRHQLETAEELRPYYHIRHASRDAALDHFDADPERAEQIKAKFDQLETEKLAEAAQLRLTKAQHALAAAQAELDAASAAILTTAQVAEESESAAAHDMENDPAAFADHVAAQLETAHS